LRSPKQRIELRAGFLSAQGGVFDCLPKLNQAGLDKSDFNLQPCSEIRLRVQLRGEFIALFVNGLGCLRLCHCRKMLISEHPDLPGQRKAKLLQTKFGNFDILIRDGLAKRSLAWKLERLHYGHAEGRSVALEDIFRVSDFASAEFKGDLRVFEESGLGALPPRRRHFGLKGFQFGVVCQCHGHKGVDGIGRHRGWCFLREKGTAYYEAKAARD